MDRQSALERALAQLQLAKVVGSARTGNRLIAWLTLVAGTLAGIVLLSPKGLNSNQELEVLAGLGIVYLVVVVAVVVLILVPGDRGYGPWERGTSGPTYGDEEHRIARGQVFDLESAKSAPSLPESTPEIDS